MKRTHQGSCHCGAVRLTIAQAPSEVTDCNCSLCRRYGVRWAYYPLAQVQVQVDVPTDTYQWGDKGIAFHRCHVCGCVTHWSSVNPARDRTGINARLLPPEVLAQARVRWLDGADSWTYRDEAPPQER